MNAVIRSMLTNLAEHHIGNIDYSGLYSPKFCENKNWYGVTLTADCHEVECATEYQTLGVTIGSVEIIDVRKVIKIAVSKTDHKNIVVVKP